MVKPSLNSSKNPVNANQFRRHYVTAWLSLWLMATTFILFWISLGFPSYIREGERYVQPQPLIDMVTIPFESHSDGCPQHFEEISPINLPSIDVEDGCICPQTSGHLADSHFGACLKVEKDVGCFSIPGTTIPSFPLWEPMTYGKVCVKRGGSPLLSVNEEGAFVARPTYDPEDPRDTCPSGFRKCGSGICFDVGVECPIVGVARRSDGFLHPLRATRDDGTDRDVALQPLVSLGLEHTDGGPITLDSLVMRVPHELCSPFLPALPSDLACPVADPVCSFYKELQTRCSIPSFDPAADRFSFVLTKEEGGPELASLNGIVPTDHPTSLDKIWPLLLYFAFAVLFKVWLWVSMSALYLYDFRSWGCFCAIDWASSMRALKRRMWNVAVLTSLLVVVSFLYWGYLFDLALKIHSIPSGLFLGKGKRMANAILAFVILSAIYHLVFGFAIVIVCWASALSWDLHGKRLWKEEMEEEKAAKAKEMIQAKRIQISHQVSNMSEATKAEYRSALQTV